MSTLERLEQAEEKAAADLATLRDISKYPGRFREIIAQGRRNGYAYGRGEKYSRSWEMTSPRPSVRKCKKPPAGLPQSRPAEFRARNQMRFSPLLAFQNQVILEQGKVMDKRDDVADHAKAVYNNIIRRERGPQAWRRRNMS